MLIADECHQKCPLINAPVCGSDGNTYVNQCTLQAKACAEKAQIKVVHKGDCQDASKKDNDPCDNICKSDQQQKIDPICGSDNKTYVNECILQVKNCRENKNVEKVADQACALEHLVYDASDNDEDYELDLKGLKMAFEISKLTPDLKQHRTSIILSLFLHFPED